MITARRRIAPHSGHHRRSVRLAGVSLALVAGTGILAGAAGTAAVAASTGRAGGQRMAGLPGPGQPVTRSGPIPGSILGGVSCQAGGSCMAAGYRQTSSTAYTLTERWNGSAWAVVPSPNPAGGKYSGFTDLTCASAGECFAGGSYNKPNRVTLIERWNGTQWSISPSANPAGSGFNYVYGLGCATVSSCFAVGQAYTPSLAYYPLTERWNGSRWLLVRAPEPAGSQGAIFGGVACPAVNDCLAVGVNRTSRAYVTLAEQWNGSAWKVLPGPSGATATGYLDGVTCVSDQDCYAVGFTGTTADAAQIQRWNGSTWSQVATPSPAGATDSYLYNVSCLDASSCWAAGMYTVGAAHRTLLEHWNGTTWTIVPSPTPSGTSYSALTEAACISAASCVAVGFAEKGGVNSALAERWNGRAWSLVSAPGRG